MQESLDLERSLNVTVVLLPDREQLTMPSAIAARPDEPAIAATEIELPMIPALYIS